MATRLVTDRLTELTSLCARFPVSRLWLFGSATGDNFRFYSDLDFLVEFGSLNGRSYSESFFGLLDDLEDLYERPVDLVNVDNISNPYLWKSVLKTRRLLYEVDQKVSA